MKLNLFLWTIMASGMLLAGVANAEDFQVSLKEGAFRWDHNEYISGGQIVVSNGNIKEFHQTRIIGTVTNNPKLGKAKINLLYFQPSGSPPDKAGEFALLDNWFSVTQLTCDKQACPLTLEGEIYITRDNGANSKTERKIHISNNDFTFKQISK